MQERGYKVMKLVCLDPVTYRSTEKELAYMGKFLNAGTELINIGIEEGPYVIQSEYDEAMAQPAVVKLCRKAAEDGADGIFINCFGDPGVRAAREVVDIPVFGGFEPAVLTAMGMADRIAIVTVLDNVLPMINGSIMRAGIRDRIACVRSVGIPVDQLSAKDELINALTAQSREAVKENGAQAVVLGCTAMIDVAENVRQQLAGLGYDIPVLEAAQTALKVLEMHVSMGLCHSKRTYMPVPG